MGYGSWAVINGELIAQSVPGGAARIYWGWIQTAVAPATVNRQNKAIRDIRRLGKNHSDIRRNARGVAL
jgi:hypothetical protein